LAKIALYFLNFDVSTNEGKSCNNRAITELTDQRGTFVSAINQQACHLNALQTIINVKKFLLDKEKFKLRLKGSKQQERNEKNLNLVSMSIFTHWMRFDAQKKLKDDVDYYTTTKKSRKKKVHSVAQPVQQKTAYKKSPSHVRDCLAKHLPTMTS
jgi:hypothetical protein